MRHVFRALLAAAALMVASTTFASPSMAGQDVVKLSVPGMSCAACPITVRKGLERVDGVLMAEVSFEELTAVVTYDPAITTVEALVEATTNVGYPSSVIE